MNRELLFLPLLMRQHRPMGGLRPSCRSRPSNTHSIRLAALMPAPISRRWYRWWAARGWSLYCHSAHRALTMQQCRHCRHVVVLPATRPRAVADAASSSHRSVIITECHFASILCGTRSLQHLALLRCLVSVMQYCRAIPADHCKCSALRSISPTLCAQTVLSVRSCRTKITHSRMAPPPRRQSLRRTAAPASSGPSAGGVRNPRTRRQMNTFPAQPRRRRILFRRP